MKKPEVIMLCGLTGSGKSTYAEELIKRGYTKLSIDESVHAGYGRADVDYPGHKYRELEATVKKELKKELAKLMSNGTNVVLDYGFWKKADRDHYKRIIEENGGQWKLVYLKAGREVLSSRLKPRNKRQDANAFHITENMLDDFIDRFEEPAGEGEETVER